MRRSTQPYPPVVELPEFDEDDEDDDLEDDDDDQDGDEEEEEGWMVEAGRPSL
jgi:hypothetical protein